MGRPRKPMEELQRNGSFDKHPDRVQQRMAELMAEIERAKAAGPIGDPPACFHPNTYIGEQMIALWKETIAEAPPGVLTFHHRKHVEGLVRLLYKIRKAPTTAKTADFNSYFAAAKDLGLTAIGIEREEQYCEAAATRLSQEVPEFT